MKIHGSSRLRTSHNGLHTRLLTLERRRNPKLDWISMEPNAQRDQAVRRELDTILSSPGFIQSKRLSDFLRFVVERHLNGRDDELKETLLAVEVYGRKADYDPKQDSIVRTEAGRLRAKLIEYYAGEGRNDSVIVELPKGRYAPVFHITDVAAARSQRTFHRAWLRVG